MIPIYAAFTLKQTAWAWTQRLGGPGLILIGLVDSSVIPFPGGMDVFTILLSTSHRELWWYYAIMATIGSVIGGYLTYRVGERGGQETLEKKLSKRRAKKIRSMFEKRGFLTILLGSVAPPPVPIAPFFIVPGVMKYPLRKFFIAVTLGRSLRYALMAYLGSIYGRSVFHWLFRYYRPLLYVLIGLGVAGGVLALYYWRRSKRQPKRGPVQTKPVRKAA